MITFCDFFKKYMDSILKYEEKINKWPSRIERRAYFP
jgi:hypothetical protein